MIFSFAIWQGKELEKKELELQEAKQKMGDTADKLVDALEEVITKPKITKLNLSYFPEKEIEIINAAALRNDLKGSLYPILYAIRKAENGRPGCEFGIIHHRAWNTNLNTQAGWAAATVQKNYDRWAADVEDISKIPEMYDFIVFLGNRYCPIGAGNDPNNLNKNWIGNVTKWTEKIRISSRETL